MGKPSFRLKSYPGKFLTQFFGVAASRVHKVVHAASYPLRVHLWVAGIFLPGDGIHHRQFDWARGREFLPNIKCGDQVHRKVRLASG